jgi:CheY-like chemotaxis protein
MSKILVIDDESKIRRLLTKELEANGFDAPAFLEDLLATVMADEINKDVLQSLITVSKRYKVQGLCENGIIDLSYDNSPEASRKLYEVVCEMNSEIQRTTPVFKAKTISQQSHQATHE